MQLIRLHTCYYLRKAIIYQLWAWRKNVLQPLPTLKHVDNDLKEAILEQRQLGWKVFLEGLVSTKLIAYQQYYHKRTETQHRAFNWPQKAIKAG